jgi:hypothetical protein
MHYSRNTSTHIDGTHGRNKDERSPYARPVGQHKLLDTRDVQEREGDPEERNGAEAEAGSEEIGVERSRQMRDVRVRVRMSRGVRV